MTSQEYIDVLVASVAFWIAIATGLTVIALVITGLLGPSEGGTQQNLTRTIAGYYLIGAANGLMIGLFWPIGRFWIGAALLGFAVVVVTYGVFQLAERGLPKTEDWPAILEVALIAGPLSGVFMKYYIRRDRQAEFTIKAINRLLGRKR
jgi:hypothetical protein